MQFRRYVFSLLQSSSGFRLDSQRLAFPCNFRTPFLPKTPSAPFWLEDEQESVDMCWSCSNGIPDSLLYPIGSDSCLLPPALSRSLTFLQLWQLSFCSSTIPNLFPLPVRLPCYDSSPLICQIYVNRISKPLHLLLPLPRMFFLKTRVQPSPPHRSCLNANVTNLESPN